LLYLFAGLGIDLLVLDPIAGPFVQLVKADFLLVGRGRV
jgi:hypothetical protein